MFSFSTLEGLWCTHNGAGDVRISGQYRRITQCHNARRTNRYGACDGDVYVGRDGNGNILW